MFYIDFIFKIYVYNFYYLSSKEITDTKIKTSSIVERSSENIFQTTFLTVEY